MLKIFECSRKIRTLAVLPFTPVVISERNEALEIGMAETIINKLTVIRGLTTLPLNTVRKYTNPERDARGVGRELGATWCSTGKSSLTLIGSECLGGW